MKDTDPCILIQDLQLFLPRVPRNDPGIKDQVYRMGKHLMISDGPNERPEPKPAPPGVDPLQASLDGLKRAVQEEPR